MLEVIGAGLGRTGTSSVKEALERLGFGPCHHMHEVIEHPETIRGWLRAAEGGPVDWDELLGAYHSAVAWPSVSFWRDLIDVYPDAKVLLTVRDPNAWYDSALHTIYRVRGADPQALPPAVRQRYEEVPALREHPRLTDRLIWDGTFGGRFADRNHALAVYAEHLAEVRATVPADRLLEFDVAQGWQPLCAFLGVDVPDEPFPRLNTSESFRRNIIADS